MKIRNHEITKSRNHEITKSRFEIVSSFLRFFVPAFLVPAFLVPAFLGFLVPAFLVLAPAAARAQDIGLTLGTTVHPVVLADLDGKPVDLGKYIGKVPVMLEFWATWCPLCRALEPQMKSAQQKFGKNLQVVVVAVGVNQTPRSIKRHLEKHALPGLVVWDGDGEAVRAFMAPGTSYVVVLNKAGKVVYTGAGSDQKLMAAAAKATRS